MSALYHFIWVCHIFFSVFIYLFIFYSVPVLLSFIRGSKNLTYIFILCIYDVLILIFYGFGVMNYVHVEMNILKDVG